MLYFQFKYTYLNKQSNNILIPPFTQNILFPQQFDCLAPDKLGEEFVQALCENGNSASLGTCCIGRSVEPLIRKGKSHLAKNINFFHQGSQVQKCHFSAQSLV